MRGAVYCLFFPNSEKYIPVFATIREGTEENCICIWRTRRRYRISCTKYVQLRKNVAPPVSSEVFSHPRRSSREGSPFPTRFSCPRSSVQEKRCKMRVSILKACSPPATARFSPQEKSGRGKERKRVERAVKRTNLPSTRSVESLAATVFSRVLLFLFFTCPIAETFLFAL